MKDKLALKWIRNGMSGQGLKLAFIIFATVVNAAITVLYALLVKNIVNEATSAVGSAEKIVIYAVAVGGAVLLQCCLTLFTGLIRENIRARAETQFRKRAFDAVLNSEKQAGRMFTSLIGIEERVSPNEIDEDSIYSIYHRTVEWTRKKELGVIVYNSYPISVKEIIKLYVATPDLCIYNYAKMIQRQQLTQIKDKLWELVLPTRLKANSYATFIIHYCEGQEKEGSDTHSVKGKWLDGDVYRLEFDETGRFTNITNKQDNVFYNFEADLALLTPSPSNPHLHIPHGLPPTDPSYLSPVFLIILADS